MGLLLFSLCRQFKQHTDMVLRETTRLRADSVGKLNDLQTELSQLREELMRSKQESEMRELHGGATAPYTTGSRLAQKGGGVSDLMEGCGLTQAEAELILILHGKSLKRHEKRRASR